MAATCKAILRPALQPGGPRPVNLVFTVNRQAKYLSLGFAVPEKDWNEDGSLQKPNWIRSKNTGAESFNKTIQRRLKLAMAWINYDPTLTSAAWRDAVKAGHEPGKAPAAPTPAQEDFLAYFAKEVARRKVHGNPRSAEKLESILNKLKVYRGWIDPSMKPGRLKKIADGADRSQLLTGWVPLTEGQPARPLPFSELTASFIRDYRVWLEKVVGNKGQTPAKELSFIKTIVALAIDDNKLEYHQNPFKRMSLGTGEAKEKEKLSDEEVLALETVELPAEKWYQVSRDAWLLQYYLFGARVADVLLLRWRTVQQDIKFQEQKTGKWKTVARHERLDRVLHRYAGHVTENDFVLPLLDAREWYTKYPEGWSVTQLEESHEFRAHYVALLKRIESLTTLLNQYIKKVATEHAGIQKHITNHVARHSFTAMARRKGVGSFDLRDMLNHESVEQTERYAGSLEKDQLAHRAHELYGPESQNQ
ncbi:tyrosine-type recombinase/integrase [Hymenobacter metallicola]|uniref:Tyr recombinase domain-containing protein n=1 Tax=Hymenobacter metallicola TaxID=2563114 RepID=A0A4Z0QLZ0_9BACT|nr:site-specific integrase [Hymenobacter metallicola]TGE29752.1 hypothetical protein E5K02_09920 [Hymenobacter metallicola]